MLDIDYHHGNGAQDIFYTRADVLTVSIHGHPSHAYPNFSGYADEQGEGEGTGFNHNYPLEPPVDDERYLDVLDKALKVIQRFKPRFLIVSLGFDVMRGDPTGSFSVSVNGLTTWLVNRSWTFVDRPQPSPLHELFKYSFVQILDFAIMGSRSAMLIYRGAPVPPRSDAR